MEREREKACEKSNIFSIDSKTETESLLMIVFGSEFQTAKAEHLHPNSINSVCQSFYQVIVTSQLNADDVTVTAGATRHSHDVTAG